MSRFERGVHWYTYKIARISFPEDEVTCIGCPCIGSEYGVKRNFCRLNGEYIPDPDYMVGGSCPLLDEEPVEDEETPIE